MTTTTESTQTMGALAADFATALGVDSSARRESVDLEQVGLAYVMDARIRDARARYEAFAAECPALVDTDWTWPQYDLNRAAIATITSWQYAAKGVIATGPTGRGKTRAIVELFRRIACDEGRDVRYFAANDWFARLQSFVNYGRDDACGWVEACARRPLVVLDDLGQEALQTARTSWAQAWLFRFLDIRIAAKLPLIVSTNMSAREMAIWGGKLRGDPLLRRLLDLCEPVKFV